MLWHCMQLVELFGSTRDEWMEDDLHDWLAANEIYDGVPAVVEHLRSNGTFYIVTTKQVWCKSSVLSACWMPNCYVHHNQYMSISI